MSHVRTLKSPPNPIELLARAALPLVPGASKLPFVAGGGREVPDLELRLDGVTADPRQLADYADVCGFALRDTLPATYLHIRAFPLHMALMTDGSFPFPAIGLVHLANKITVHRPLSIKETYDLRVTATKLQLHPKGRTFTLVSEARVAGELVWEDESTMLRRGGGSKETTRGESGSGGSKDADGDDGRAGGGGRDASAGSAAEPLDPSTGPARSSAGTTVEWQLPDDLGRRYGGVSGDRNPIHMHPYTARLFGFPRAIAHGMWTKAACLAALEAKLPDAYTVDVSFKRPILLPSRVTFAAQDDQGSTRFQVRSTTRPDTLHLEGTVTP
jgi:acyl dehydratase